MRMPFDGLLAVMVDTHFIVMVTKEMKNPRTTWQEVVHSMIKRCWIKIKGVQNGKAKDDGERGRLQVFVRQVRR